jgi:hypothetical protein
MDSLSLHQPPRSLARVAIIALVMAVVAMPLAVRSSSALTLSTSDVSNVVTYNILDLLSPTPSYITVNETAFTTLLLHPLPQNTKLVLSSSYDGGSPSTVLGCTIVNPTNAPIGTCSFQVPFKGWGDYLLIGSVYGSNGTLLAQTGIDPLIEPEWK